jgi:hypothetical protein
VEDERKARELGLDFFKDVKTKLWFLPWFEFKGSVGSPDSDCQAVDSGLADKFDNIGGMGEMPYLSSTWISSSMPAMAPNSLSTTTPRA